MAELGHEVDWRPPPRPEHRELRGAHVLLRPISAEDAEPLHEVSRDPAIWTYLPTGPYADAAALRAALVSAETSQDPMFFAIAALPDATPVGVASYLNIEPEHGSIEIGHIWFGSTLQRTTGATEAIYLLARHAFDDLGYRRFEWKCNALNEPSRRAADRFGFTFEGIFRNHMVVKGRNRDTAWYAMTAEEWPTIRARFEEWLDASNFDTSGKQLRSLGEGV